MTYRSGGTWIVKQSRDVRALSGAFNRRSIGDQSAINRRSIGNRAAGKQNILPREHQEPERGSPLTRVPGTAGIEEVDAVFRNVGLARKMRVAEEDNVAPRRLCRGDEPALARLGTESVPVVEEQTMPLALQNTLLRGRIEKPEAVTVAAHGIDGYAVLLLKPRKVGEPVTQKADKIRVTVHRKHAAEPRRIPVRIR